MLSTSLAVDSDCKENSERTSCFKKRFFFLAEGLGRYSRPRAQFLPTQTNQGPYLLRMKATLGKNPVAAVMGRVDS